MRGFIYPLFEGLMSACHFLSLVEWIKSAVTVIVLRLRCRKAIKVTFTGKHYQIGDVVMWGDKHYIVIRRNADKYWLLPYAKTLAAGLSERRAIHYTIDTYITLKYLFLVASVYGLIHPTWAVPITWYLIISTTYTYFRYHHWQQPYEMSLDSKRRRWVTLCSALVFVVLSYAYLYLDAGLVESWMEGVDYSLSAKAWRSQKLIMFVLIAIVLENTIIPPSIEND